MGNREAMMRAYGLLWHFMNDATPNAKLVSEARILLREALTRDELKLGIEMAEPVCNRIGVRFTSTITQMDKQANEN